MIKGVVEEKDGGGGRVRETAAVSASPLSSDDEEWDESLLQPLQ